MRFEISFVLYMYYMDCQECLQIVSHALDYSVQMTIAISMKACVSYCILKSVLLIIVLLDKMLLNTSSLIIRN